MSDDNLQLGEKTEEYPQGYGYCQCGCGRYATRLSNGNFLHFLASHIPKPAKKLKRFAINKTLAKRHNNRLQYRNEIWSKNNQHCILCGNDNIPHMAKGYCLNCYAKMYRKKDKKEVAKLDYRTKEDLISEKQKIQRNLATQIKVALNKDKLKFLYYDKKMSLGDIAQVYKCSKTYISNLRIEYGIPLKTNSRARIDSISMGKNINNYLVDKDFFKNWTNEMAYVLGFFCADGNIAPQLNSLTIAQKEIEILEKIKKLMKSEHPIHYYKKHQDLYRLSINSTEIVEDLLRLGITPHKSLKIEFPKVPVEYVNHFLRGNFDGDGSICFNKNKKGGGTWRISFLSGSIKFIEGVKKTLENLVGVGIHNIHKHKTANAYNLYFHSKDDINKIFNFFYDSYSMEHELYLKRKHEIFLVALKFYAAKDQSECAQIVPIQHINIPQQN